MTNMAKTTSCPGLFLCNEIGDSTEVLIFDSGTYQPSPNNGLFIMCRRPGSVFVTNKTNPSNDLFDWYYSIGLFFNFNLIFVLNVIIVY